MNGNGLKGIALALVLVLAGGSGCVRENRRPGETPRLPRPAGRGRVAPDPAAPSNPRAPAAPPATSVPPVPARPAEAPLIHVRLTLEETLRRAEDHRPEIAEGRALVEAAEGRRIQEGLPSNPVAVLRMESAPLGGATDGDTQFVTGVTQSLPIGGRIGASQRVAEAEIERARSALDVKRMEIRRRVQGAFAAALSLQEAVRIHDEALRISEDGLAVARARVAAGDALADEVARAEIERSMALLDRDRGRSRREAALAALATEMWEPSARVESIEGTLDVALDLPSLETLFARIAEHPLATEAEREIEVFRRQATLAEAQRIPDIDLDLFYRRFEDQGSDAFDVGLAVGIPLWNRNQGRLREARAEVEAAGARSRVTRLNLVSTLRQSHAALGQALARARVLRDEILPRSAAVRDVLEKRYAAGDLSMAEVLPIRRESTLRALDRLDALREAMEAWADLAPWIVAR